MSVVYTTNSLKSPQAMNNAKDPITPRRPTSVSSLIETGRDSIWSLVAEFPSLVRTDPVKSKTKVRRHLMPYEC